MDQISNENNNQKANHAWRKNPRKFAPKSRLGCKTCKIRRIKCDLSRPSCSRCQSTGRKCDGYGAVFPKTDINLKHCHNVTANTTNNFDCCHTSTMIDVDRPKERHPNYHGFNLKNLGPLLILPATKSANMEAMSFFEDMSIKHLNEYQPCKSWRKTLVFFSQTVPSVRYAAIALSLLHRNYLERDPSDLQKSQQQNVDPLLYYNRAIRHLLNQDIGDSIETIAITLLVCYLFTCFDQLAGNYVQAMQHLHGGVKLSRKIDNATPNVNDTYDAQPSGVRKLIFQVTRQIHRLDMQAVTFLVDWTPSDIQDTPLFHSSNPESAFRSLDQAADHLQVLVAKAMKLRNSEQEQLLSGRKPPPSSSLKDIVLGQLKTWSNLFKNMLLQSSCYPKDFENQPLILLLRLQYTVTWTFLSSCGPGREMEYDNFLPQFQECVSMADEVAAAHERYSGSLKPTFTPEIGILPVLYIIGVKCRNPVVRRQVLSILRRQPIREAVWDSISTARVVERVIEIEEGRFEEGKMLPSMGQIAVWQRVEALSWEHVVSGDLAPRLDIMYTFCARHGLHNESLLQ